MSTDEALTQALAQYSCMRRRIHRGVAMGVIGSPVHGGMDILRWISKLQAPNVTSLAEAMGITRGGASKAVAKLRALGLVTSYHQPNNRKAIYYALTPEGEVRLARLHETMDALSLKEQQYIAPLPEAQKEAVIAFLCGFTAHLGEAWPQYSAEEGGRS